MTDEPLDPKPMPDTVPSPVPNPVPNKDPAPEPLTEVPGEGGFNDGKVDIDEPRQDEIPPI